MNRLRYSNLAVMMAAVSSFATNAFMRDHEYQRLLRSVERKQVRFYGAGRSVIHETVDCRAATRRRRHIAEGRYPKSQILKAA